MEGTNKKQRVEKAPDPEKTAREHKCLSEVNEVLKKYNCETRVLFKQQMVLGESVLTYSIQIAAK
jgi:hypothetical protein